MGLEGSKNSLGFKASALALSSRGRNKAKLGLGLRRDFSGKEEGKGRETQLGLRRGPEAVDMGHGPNDTIGGDRGSGTPTTTATATAKARDSTGMSVGGKAVDEQTGRHWHSR